MEKGSSKTQSSFKAILVGTLTTVLGGIILAIVLKYIPLHGTSAGVDGNVIEENEAREATVNGGVIEENEARETAAEPRDRFHALEGLWERTAQNIAVNYRIKITHSDDDILVSVYHKHKLAPHLSGLPVSVTNARTGGLEWTDARGDACRSKLVVKEGERLLSVSTSCRRPNGSLQRDRSEYTRVQ